MPWRKALRWRKHCIGIRLRAKPEIDRRWLKPRAFAVVTRRVRAVFRQQHANVHLVRFCLQPVEESPHAIPALVRVLLPRTPGVVAINHIATIVRPEIAKRHIHRNVARHHVLLQIVLTLLETRRLPRFDRAFAERFAFVGNHQSKINANHATKAATSVTRSERIVERERRCMRVGIGDVAGGAMEVGGVTPNCLFLPLQGGG